MTYSSLEQRIAQGYIDMLPSFVPYENAPVTISEQECFYDSIKGLYQLAYTEPLLFVATLHDDDAFPSRYKKSYGKPKLIMDMKKFKKSVDDLLQALFLLGRSEEVRLSKKQINILSRVGIDDLTNLPPVFKWMATKDSANIPTFSYCLFDSGFPYTSEIYARLLGETPFKRLEQWMLSQGYKRYDIYNTTASDCNLSFTIANPKWSDEPPRGGFEYKIKHTGIAAQFDYYVKNPTVIGLCIPNGMKLYLEHFSSMDKSLQEFVTARTKKCDMCRYCVQTDKTGTRALARTKVKFDGKEFLLCNYYPGYYYSWAEIDDSLADMLIKMLSFMDSFVKT